MASPPFDINQALPGDSDIVSQHPTNARVFRDIVESWLLVNHNNLGQHTYVDLPSAAPPAAPGANVARIFAKANGRVQVIYAGPSTFDIQVPAGTMFFTASASLPPGYLFADGSAVSRTTFGDLFAAIGVVFGDGDHSTTFNVPNALGRMLAGSGNTSILAGGILGASIGNQSVVIPISAIPANVSVSGTASVTSTVADIVRYGGAFDTANVAGGLQSIFRTGGAINAAISSTGTISGATINASQSALTIIPPVLVVTPIIKY